MNILEIMRGLGLTGSMKAKLLKMGVSEKYMEGVYFTSLDSLNKFAEKIVPNLLSKNPAMKEQIKGCSWLEGKTKDEVCTVVDSI